MAHEDMRYPSDGGTDPMSPPPMARSIEEQAEHVPTTANDAAFRGHRVVDEHHRGIGRVTDVIFGDDGTPRWAVVSPGLFRGEHYLPLDHSYVSLDGDLVVPYDKRTVTKSPKADRDHVLTSVVERDLEHYYHLAA
jgi:PRC-barrel domain